MNMIKTALLIPLLVLTGCALSPQSITIIPDIKVANANNDQQQKTIQIGVNDARANKVIGTRGGIYADTSAITADADITQSVRNSLTAAYRVLGYNVLNSGANVQIIVDITDLTYTASGETTIRAVETAAALKATCQSGTYVVTNEYRITDKADVLKPPTTGENQDYINGTLSSTLQRLVNDASILDCINR
jgi:uncharacterized lipoprotein